MRTEISSTTKWDPTSGSWKISLFDQCGAFVYGSRLIGNLITLNRRQFLHGAGGLMALPFLNSLPLPAAAATVKPLAEARKRLVCIGTFLSMYPGAWHP